MNGAQAGSGFGILFVCSRNSFRSVIAERLARRYVADFPVAATAGFAVASAGTSASPGTPMPGVTAETLARMGAATGPFASRQLSGTLVDSADLVLAAQREHLHEALLLRPGASRHCFLMLEFTRLVSFVRAAAWASGWAEGTPAGLGEGDMTTRARAVVSAAAGVRGRVPYVDPADDEIADPAAPDALWLCAREIDRAVRSAISTLCGDAGSRAGQ